MIGVWFFRYADLRDIIEHLNKDEATIDGFDKKIDEVDEKLKECGNDVDEVKNQVEILKVNSFRPIKLDNFSQFNKSVI